MPRLCRESGEVLGLVCLWVLWGFWKRSRPRTGATAAELCAELLGGEAKASWQLLEIDCRAYMDGAPTLSGASTSHGQLEEEARLGLNPSACLEPQRFHALAAGSGKAVFTDWGLLQ